MSCSSQNRHSPASAARPIYFRSSISVVPLRQPNEIENPLAALRSGTRRLLAQGIEAEAEAFLAAIKGERLADGRERVVRHGHGPERQVQTGIGPVAVPRIKLRDRGASAGGERIRFTSALLARCARRTRSLDALLPILYLRRISMGDFQEALGTLLGREAPNLSPSVIARLRGEWEADYTRWQLRDLSAPRYVYVWADGVYLQARMEPQAQYMLMLIGATPEGKKELLGFQVGGAGQGSARIAGGIPAEIPCCGSSWETGIRRRFKRFLSTNDGMSIDEQLSGDGN